MVFLSLAKALSAFGRGGVCHTAGVDDDQLGLLRDIDLAEPEGREKLANLLGFVLVDLAAQC